MASSLTIKDLETWAEGTVRILRRVKMGREHLAVRGSSSGSTPGPGDRRQNWRRTTVELQSGDWSRAGGSRSDERDGV